MGSHLNSSPHWPYNLGCVAEPIFSLRFIIAKTGMITLSSQVGWAGDFVNVLRTVAGTNWMPRAYLFHFPSQFPQHFIWVISATWLAFYLNFIVSLSVYFPLLGNGFFLSWVFHWFICTSFTGPAHSRSPIPICGTDGLMTQELQKSGSIAPVSNFPVSHCTICLRRSRQTCWSCWCIRAFLDHHLLQVWTDGHWAWKEKL